MYIDPYEFLEGLQKIDILILSNYWSLMISDHGSKEDYSVALFKVISSRLQLTFSYNDVS